MSGMAYYPTPEPPPPPSKDGSRKPLYIVVGIAGAAALVAVVGTAASNGSGGSDSALQKAADMCGTFLVDGGHTWTFDEKVSSNHVHDLAIHTCMTTALFPASLVSRMDATTSFDGTQTATVDGLTVSWSFNGISDNLFTSITDQP